MQNQQMLLASQTKKKNWKKLLKKHNASNRILRNEDHAKYGKLTPNPQKTGNNMQQNIVS